MHIVFLKEMQLRLVGENNMKDNDKLYNKMISEFDQYIKFTNDTIPICLKTFYDTLGKEGFVNKQAFILTRDYFQILMGGLLKERGDMDRENNDS